MEAPPAALGADWLTSALDQIAFNWVSSPFAMHMEQVAVGWLADLFGLPDAWSGVLTTGATSANFTGLAAARRWWGLQHGVDVEQEGMSALPAVPVLASGIAHVSAIKRCELGIGRPCEPSPPWQGQTDIDAMEAELRRRTRAGIMLATAGGRSALRPSRNGGRFGRQRLAAGMARPVCAPPFPPRLGTSSGIIGSFRRRPGTMVNVPTTARRPSSRPDAIASLHSSAAYRVRPRGSPVFASWGGESRRARSLAVWATLHAYGAAETGNVSARRLAGRLATGGREPDSSAWGRPRTSSASVQPSVVAEISSTTSTVDSAGRARGRSIFFGRTVYAGKALRPAIVNWRTEEADVDLIVPITRELGARLRQE